METVAQTPERTTIWNKNFICVMLSNACLSLSSSAVNPLISTYAKFLGAGVVLVGALTGMYYGVSFSMRPISGPVTTKLDKKKLMIFSYILGIIVNLGYALTGSIGLFIAFRILNGVQFSIIGSLAMTVASDTLPRDKLGSGLGFYGLTNALAMAIGPQIGIAMQNFGTGLRGEGFGFTMVFLLSAFCMTMALVPCFVLKVPKRTKTELASAGAWYKNIIAPSSIPAAVIMMLLCMGSMLYTAYLVPFSQAKGIPGIAIYFTVYALVMLAARPLSGKMVDRYGVFRLILLGTAIYASSFIIVGLSHTLVTVLIGAVVASIGFGTAYPAVQTMCIQSVPSIKRAVASNTNFFGMDLGFFLGPFVGSLVYNVLGDYSYMYMTMAIPVALSMAVLAVSWKRYERNVRRVTQEADASAPATDIRTPEPAVSAAE